MVIECSNCRARYRINPLILKGFQGAEVRCRKCGGKIIVVKSGMPSTTGVPGSGKERTVGPADPALSDVRPGGSVNREAPSPGHVHRRPIAAETTGDSPAATERGAYPPGAVSENVLSLDHFRGARPRKGLVGSFDISGVIHPEPAISLEEPVSPDASPPPVAPPPETRESVLPRNLSGPIEWRNEGFIPAAGGTTRPFPDTPGNPMEEPDLRRSPFQASFSNSPSPRPTHILMVYLVLLFLGGCGYLLIQLLSGFLHAGG